MTPRTSFILLLTLAVALAPGAAQALRVNAPATNDAQHVADARALLDTIHNAPPTLAGALTINAAIGKLTPQGASVIVAPNYGDFATQAPNLHGAALAEAATRAQAAALGLSVAPASLTVHATPSEAVFSFLHAEGASLTPSQVEQVRALDTLPASEASALARTVDAFAAMNNAAGVWLTSKDPAQRAGVFAARLHLIDAINSLQAALPATAQPTSGPQTQPGEFILPPFLRIAPLPHDDTILDNFILNIDLGGNDDYQNNAGGTWFGNCDLPAYAAASIDVGQGSDSYNLGVYRQDSCGKNGGSMGGAGFLFDDGALLAWPGDRLGTDGLNGGINGGADGASALGFAFAPGATTTRAGDYGTNGGAYNGGVGCLIGGGNVSGGSYGTNGGASVQDFSLSVGGLGMMIGSASAGAGWYGTNGGAYGAGSVGLAVGTGSFAAGSYGTNGGGSNLGAGSSVGGNYYYAGYSGTNGGGDQLGTGSVLGARASYYSWGGQGVNGGGNAGGHGTVIDPLASSFQAGGNGANGGADGTGSSGFAWGGTSFSAGGSGTNGGGNNAGVGTLIAGPLGASSYSASGGSGANGGGELLGVGHLIDPGLAWGSYNAGDFGTNGGGDAEGVGFLLDAAGNDRYTGGLGGTNGAGNLGFGTLIDLAGDDAYDGDIISNGGGVAGVGLLIDASGNDSWTDPFYSCSNASSLTCTQVFKDGSGFLIDA